MTARHPVPNPGDIVDHVASTKLNLIAELPVQSRILAVDDDEAALETLERVLRKAGFQYVQTLTDSRLVLPKFMSFRPDILLLDLRMPHLDGFMVLRQVRDRVPKGELFPILAISGDMSTEAKQRALVEGATDFISKPYDAIEVVLRVKNLLESRMLSRQWEQRVQEQTEEIRALQAGLAERLAMLAEFRDYRGGPHTRRVGELASRIAAEMGLPAPEVDVISRAAPLHDIGKLAIPDAILLKQGTLTLEEMDILKTHTTVGARVLSGSASRILRAGEEIALYHHENWDGTGYTPGLAGESIPLAARITAVADVFDALTHERPYKEAWSVEASVDQIINLKGTKFDPAVVDAFLKVASLEGLPLIEFDDELKELARPFERHFSTTDSD